MPGLDGTGPRGYGPLTGGGFGPCGRGLAFRRGFGRGFGLRGPRGFQTTEPINLTKEEQKKILEAELKEIEAEKQEIEKRLKELE
jgi:hypothetical protein